MQMGFSALGQLARVRDFKSRRESSFDHTGGNRDCIPIKPGRRHVLADVDGPGCIKHIWSTNSQAQVRDAMRSLVLRTWWDGEKTPSVELPPAKKRWARPDWPEFVPALGTPTGPPRTATRAGTSRRKR